MPDRAYVNDAVFPGKLSRSYVDTLLIAASTTSINGQKGHKVQVDLTQDEMDQIIYCLGVTRGLLYRDMTREVDEEIRALLQDHVEKLDTLTEEIMNKFAPDL